MGQDKKDQTYIYEVVEDWAQLPKDWSFHEVAAVGTDADDNVYVFSRSDHPVTVFARDGKFLGSWGEGEYLRPHGITMGPDSTIYLTDDGNHCVKKCTLEGKVLLTLGLPGKPSSYQSGDIFHRCTHVALDPATEDIFVSDGYGNSRIHKFSREGKHLLSWGEPGTDPGQFNLPHNIVADREGYLYVADRENHRVQVFDANGRYETQWNNMHRPCALFMDSRDNDLCYVGELGPDMPVNKIWPNIGPRITIVDKNGNKVARIDDDRGQGEGIGQFIAPHGLAVDSFGDIYVGEVSWTAYGSKLDPPREVRSLQKLVRKK